MLQFPRLHKKSGMSQSSIVRLQIQKFNSNHDERGRFGKGSGIGSDPMNASTKEELNAAVLRNPKYVDALAKSKARGDVRNDVGVLDKEGRYTPEANAENVNVAQSMLNPNSRVPFGQRPTATIMLGKTGAGKSSLVDKLGLRENSTLIDADTAMSKLPGYDPDLAGAYHGRGGDIADNTLLTMAAENNMNIVYDTTGKTSSKMLDIADNLQQLGYDIHVIHASIPDLEAGKRAYSRWASGGRLVPIDFVTRAFGERPGNTYKLLKEYYAKNAREYDTSTRESVEITKSLFRQRRHLRKQGRPSIVHVKKIGGREKIKKYSDAEQRDDHGRWSAGGSSDVIFEVAPNPDDKALADRWNSLTPAQREEKNNEVMKDIIPKIMAERGIKGEIQAQFGSYENDTNQSFTLRLPEGTDPAQIVDATKAIGFNLSQKGMMTLSGSPFPGGKLEDTIHIESSKDFDLLSSKKMYDDIRTIQINGNPVVGGATTVGKIMTIVNFDEYKSMDTYKIAKAIQAKFPKGYSIRTGQKYAWLPTKENDYGIYGSDDNNSHETGGNLAKGPLPTGGHTDFRDTVRSIIEKVLEGIFKRYPAAQEFYRVIVKDRKSKAIAESQALEKRLVVFSEYTFIPAKKSRHSFATRMALKKSYGNTKFALTLNKAKAHPVGKAFQDLHKKYEPMLAKAFLDVCHKIKSQINIKDLVEAVDNRNIHQIVRITVGNKFRDLLSKEFKSILFEGYHAGALIGAQQLSRQYIKKGGPGSGPQTHDGVDYYRRIIANQRSKEGLRPALRDLRTNEIHPGRGDELHYDILSRIGGLDQDFEEGFVTHNGNFMERNYANRTFNRLVGVGKAMIGSLDITNPAAVDYLAAELPELIAEINDEQAQAVQTILLDGIQGGEDGPAIARQIRNVVGLTEKQAQWVSNFRDQLETGIDGSFTPVDERRLSAIDSQAATAQFNSNEKDPAMIDSLVDTYAFSLLNKRAMDISATEILQASREGQRNLWDQAVDQGYLDKTITKKHWLAVNDAVTREDHSEAQDMNEPDGISYGDQYDTPWGPSDGPGDGPDEEIINCRCVEFLTFEDAFGGNSEDNEIDNQDGLEEE